jgi:hypothetical protein
MTMTETAAFKAEALSTDELDRVAGGIIIVGGLQRNFQLYHQSSVLDRVAINPQPLPPRILSFGH